MLKIKNELEPQYITLDSAYCNKLYLSQDNELFYLCGIWDNIWTLVSLTKRTTRLVSSLDLRKILVREVPSGTELVWQ